MAPDMYLTTIMARHDGHDGHDIIGAASFGTKLWICSLAIGNHSRNAHLHLICELGSVLNEEQCICVVNVAHG